MKKLPPGEAKRRRDERNHLKNEARKAERVARLTALGLPLHKTPEAKREYNRMAQRKRRAEQKVLNQKRPAWKPTSAKSIAVREAYRARKNAEQRALYALKMQIRSQSAKG